MKARTSVFLGLMIVMVGAQALAQAPAAATKFGGDAGTPDVEPGPGAQVIIKPLVGGDPPGAPDEGAPPSKSPDDRAAAPGHAPLPDEPTIRIQGRPLGSPDPGRAEPSARHAFDGGSKEKHDGGLVEGPPASSSNGPEPAGHAATYHGQTSPLVFRVAAMGIEPKDRASDATAALESALDHGAEDEREVTVRIEGDVAVVRIGPHVITTFYDGDARAAGLPLASYAAHVGTELTGFVPAQITRRAIQLFALHVFLSVFALVLAFVALRELRKLFDRWEEALDDRRARFDPISFLRVPVISGQALGGALAFGLTTGRVVAYIITVAAAFATVLGQFEPTRPLLRRLGKASTQPFVDGFEAIASAVPGLLLAAVLLLGLRGSLRVLNLLLDGVASKQIVWRFLPPSRVPLFRSLTPVLALLVLTPLLIAAAFGQFGTPLETLAIGAGVVVLAGSVPLCAAYVVGAVVLWNQELHAGDWVSLGEATGEVTRVGLGEIRLVPEQGGTVSVPTLSLLWHPVQRLSGPPRVEIELLVERDRPAEELLAAVREAITAKEEDARAELAGLDEGALRIVVRAPSVRSGVRELILIGLSDAADAGAIRLLRHPGLSA